MDGIFGMASVKCLIANILRSNYLLLCSADKRNSGRGLEQLEGEKIMTIFWMNYPCEPHPTSFPNECTFTWSKFTLTLNVPHKLMKRHNTEHKVSAQPQLSGVKP